MFEVGPRPLLIGLDYSATRRASPQRAGWLTQPGAPMGFNTTNNNQQPSKPCPELRNQANYTGGRNE